MATQIASRLSSTARGGHHNSAQPARSSPAVAPSLAVSLGLSCRAVISSTGRVASQQRHTRASFVVAAATSHPSAHGDDDQDVLEDDEDIGLSTSGSSEVDESELGELPSTRYQRGLTTKLRKDLRGYAETLAKEKKLIRLQVGQLGLTRAVLREAIEVLLKHGYVRVKLGEGCGLDRNSAASVLEKYLDCTCVHQIGFTITLYRQPGLPRPSNFPAVAPSASAAGAQAAAAAAAKAEAEERKAAAKKLGQQKPGSRPPEFTVL
ncbi:hypothetical protein HYH03_009204 [Edaphochlamys debaryana]|uniref:CRM domain-containing protein n=1 Tax=Edaphochlamys debaryana TaxID=47281 RepID=A0A835XZE5_9CHLO|nr:hypothetical protein HYH03_009204 [Edaphochlamys debaryana]|eukprot:KAG2492539.1 hypothetical protein HYH03_009204 [Edaphochlamys debaryana]